MENNTKKQNEPRKIKASLMSSAMFCKVSKTSNIIANPQPCSNITVPHMQHNQLKEIEKKKAKQKKLNSTFLENVYACFTFLVSYPCLNWLDTSVLPYSLSKCPSDTFFTA